MLKSDQPPPIIRKLVYATVGLASYPCLTWLNKLNISGTENLMNLPDANVLFVSNHQTYFADVIALLHIFGAVKWGRQNRLGLPAYLLNPFTDVNYVAAEKTMQASWISRFLTLAGSVSIKRTWNSQSGEVLQGLDTSDTRKIKTALASNWVINFPQGTTTPFAPGRKGAAFIIKQTRPIVIPVVIGGFSEAFAKQSLGVRKIGVQLSVRFKERLSINYEQGTDAILRQIMEAIEQNPIVERASHA